MAGREKKVHRVQMTYVLSLSPTIIIEDSYLQTFLHNIYFPENCLSGTGMIN